MVVKNDEEAVRIANGSGYGLSAAVFTEDLRRGFKLARRIQSGYVQYLLVLLLDILLMISGLCISIA